MKGRIAKSLLVLALACLPISIFSAGMPVFDVENWLYSILQYSQEAEDIVRQVQDVAQEVDRWQRAYEALSSGDILSAVSGISTMTSMATGYFTTATRSQEISRNLSDISRALQNVDVYRDDPTYWLELAQQVKDAQTTLNDLSMQNDQQRTEDIQTANATLSENAQSNINQAQSESQLKQIGALISTTTDQNMQQMTAQAQQFTSESIANSQKTAKELADEIAIQRLKAEMNSAIQKVSAEMAGLEGSKTQIPDNPFQGVR